MALQSYEESVTSPHLGEICLPPDEDLETSSKTDIADVPDASGIDGAEDAARQGDFDVALLLGLNSIGDSCNLNIGINASLPILVPGSKIGIGGSIGAKVTRTADGFQLSF